jgi:hypothetical protein
MRISSVVTGEDELKRKYAIKGIRRCLNRLLDKLLKVITKKLP